VPSELLAEQDVPYGWTVAVGNHNLAFCYDHLSDGLHRCQAANCLLSNGAAIPLADQGVAP